MGQIFPLLFVSFRGALLSAMYSKICFHIPNAFLGHFQLQQGTMVLCCQDAITMIVISKAYWIEFFETSTCFNIWSRFRQRWIFLIACTRQWSPIPRSDTPPWDNFWESFVRNKSVVLRVSILVMRVWWRRWK